MRLPSPHPPRRAFDFLLLGVAFGCFDGAKVRKDRVLLVEPAAVVAELDPVVPVRGRAHGDAVPEARRWPAAVHGRRGARVRGRERRRRERLLGWLLLVLLSRWWPRRADYVRA